MIVGNLGAAVQMLKVMNQQGGGQSWENNLFGQNDLNTWIKKDTRSGLTLPDTINPGTNDANILLPYLYKPTGNEYAYQATASNLEVGTGDLTLCGWFKSETSDKSAVRSLAGKIVGNSGNYGMYVLGTSGFLYMRCITTGGTAAVTTNIDFTTAGWCFLRLDINNTTKKFRCFVNEVQQGTDQSFTGTFSATNIRFTIGCDSGFTGIALSSHSDTYVYRKILTPTEGATLMARGFVTGAEAHWTFSEKILSSNYDKFSDVTGNGYHLTCVNITSSKRIYGIEGSRYSLDKGHSVYRNSVKGDLYFGVNYAGNPLYADTYSGEYTHTRIRNWAGNLTNHNLADSLILFADASWDRSDATIWSNAARAGYYDAANPKRWHPTELNQRTIDLWLNTAYKDIVFTKVSTDSIYEANRNYLEELISYDTVKAGVNFGNVLKYTKDYDFFFTGLSFTSTQPVVPKNFSIVLIITSGYTVLVDFGDGTPQLVTGTGANQTVTSAYISAGTYTVRLSYSIDKITSFSISGTSLNPETTITVDIVEFNKCLALQILHLEYMRGGYGSIELTCPALQTLYLVGESDSNKANYYGSIDELPSTMISFFFLNIIDGQLEGTTTGLRNGYQQIDSEENMNFAIDLDTMGAKDSLLHLCIAGVGATWSGSMNSLVNAGLNYISYNTMPNVTFDIGTIQNSVKTINVAGSNNGNISGNLNAVPTAVEVFIIEGSTAVTGNLEDLPATVKRLAIVTCPNVIYNGGILPAWVLTANCAINNNWSSAMVDAFLINAATNFGNATGQHIYLNYTGMGARTAASDAAVATLLGKGYTVHSN